MGARVGVKPGEEWGDLVVIEEVETVVDAGGRNRRMVKVACNCGTEFDARLESIRTGNTTRCAACALVSRSETRRTHGGTNSSEYLTWRNMLNRVSNPKVKNYAQYGGRGIRICDRWRKFENFIADMGRRPTPDHSLDRVDNEGDYEPDNCRWATRKQQAQNMSTNKYVEVLGRTMTRADLANISGHSRQQVTKWLDEGLPAAIIVALGCLEADGKGTLILRPKWSRAADPHAPESWPIDQLELL